MSNISNIMVKHNLKHFISTGDKNSLALAQAQEIAINLWEKYYKDISPNWEVSGGIVDVLLQISDMIGGIDERGFDE